MADKKEITARIDTDEQEDIPFLLDAISRTIVTEHNDAPKKYLFIDNGETIEVTEDEFIDAIMSDVAHKEVKRINKNRTLGSMRLG